MIQNGDICLLRHATPVGPLLMATAGNSLCLCDWEDGAHHSRTLARTCRLLRATPRFCETPLARRAADQLDEYFAGGRREFRLPLLMAGSEFQRAVWQALLAVSYGERLTYAQLAAAIGRPTAVRAVANAVGQNPISVIVPCHRVVATGKGLGGYAGGLEKKIRLLAREKE